MPNPLSEPADYYVGPWVAKTANGSDVPFTGAYPPEGTFASICMRSITDQASPEIDGEWPNSLFAVRGPNPGSEYDLLGSGDLRYDIDNDNRIKSIFEDRFGYRPNGAMLSDAVLDFMILGSDPTGLAGPRPLMPEPNGEFQLRLSGHSIVSRREFNYNSRRPEDKPYRDVVNRRMRLMYENQLAEESLAVNPARAGHAQRCLDFRRRKLGINKNDIESIKGLIPQHLRDSFPGLLDRESEINETWPTDGTNIASGQDNVWQVTDGDVDISSGRYGELGQNSTVESRCTTTLSSSAHSCENRVFGIAFGGQAHAVCRFAVADRDLLFVFLTSTSISAAKRTGGSFSSLDSNIGVSSTADETFLKISISSGGNFQTFIGGVLKHDFTDTSFDSNTRIGATVQNNVQTGDLFATDLAAEAVQNDNMLKSLGGPLKAVMAGRGDLRNMTKSLGGPVLNV